MRPQFYDVANFESTRVSVKSVEYLPYVAAADRSTFEQMVSLGMDCSVPRVLRPVQPAFRVYMYLFIELTRERACCDPSCGPQARNSTFLYNSSRYTSADIATLTANVALGIWEQAASGNVSGGMISCRPWLHACIVLIVIRYMCVLLIHPDIRSDPPPSSSSPFRPPRLKFPQTTVNVPAAAYPYYAPIYYMAPTSVNAPVFMCAARPRGPIYDLDDPRGWRRKQGSRSVPLAFFPATHCGLFSVPSSLFRSLFGPMCDSISFQCSSLTLILDD